MNFRIGFTLLALFVVVAGVIPFGMSQVGQTEPSMEIDMLSGQTQSPFRIQDHNDLNVFTVKPNGGLDPVPVSIDTIVVTSDVMDVMMPTWSAESPSTICPNAESGAGVYQWTYTVTADDVDPSVDSYGMFTKKKIIPNLSYQMQNIDAGAIGANWKLFIDDVEIATRTDPSVASGNYLYGLTAERQEHNGAQGTAPYASQGTVIGFKCWQSSGTPDSLRINHMWLQGFPILVVNALNISVGFIDYGIHTTWLAPTIPAQFSGVSMQSWGDCFTVASNDWDQCFARNSFTGDHEITMGSQIMYQTQGSSMTESASNNMRLMDDGIGFRENMELTVTTWK